MSSGKSEGRQRGLEGHDRTDLEVALFAGRGEAHVGRGSRREMNAVNGLREGGQLACGQDQPGGRSNVGQGQKLDRPALGLRQALGNGQAQPGPIGVPVPR